MLSGGLLAMSKQWWTEMGGYDEKMTGWGGENIDQVRISLSSVSLSNTHIYC